jgi:hypothetical protein
MKTNKPRRLESINPVPYRYSYDALPNVCTVPPVLRKGDPGKDETEAEQTEKGQIRTEKKRSLWRLLFLVGLVFSPPVSCSVSPSSVSLS